MRRLIGILFSLIFSITASSQSPVFESFKVLKNRKDVKIYCMYQDNLGYMWYGTNYGLVKYDGYNFQLFDTKQNLQELNITAIIQDTSKLFWIGHKSGKISHFDGSEFSIFDPEEGVGIKAISGFFIDNNGSIWFSTKGEGVYYFEGERRNRLYNLNKMDGLLNNHVYDIQQDKNGLYYFSTDQGISVYEKNSKIFVDEINMADGLPDNIVKDIEIVNDSILWIAMIEAGVCNYNLNSKLFSRINNWAFGSLQNMAVLSQNEVWISTQRKGLIKCIFDDTDKAWYYQYKPIHGLTSLKTNCAFIDTEENIWIGTNKGLSIRKNTHMEFLNAEIEPGFDFANVFDFTIDNNGNFWIASQEGLFKVFVNQMGKTFQEKLLDDNEMVKHSFISLYKDHRGIIWAGTYGFGVFKFNTKTLEYQQFTSSDGLGNDNVIHITGNDSAIWLSTLGGGVSKYCFDSKCFINFDEPEGLTSNYIYSTFIDSKNVIWIATDGGGVFKIADDVLEKVYKPLLDSIGKITYNITEDGNNNIWINCVNQGLLCLKEDTTIYLSEINGLRTNEISSIITDLNGNVIAVSNEGIEIIDKNNYHVEMHGENENVAYLEPNVNAVHKDITGNIWIGTAKGLIKMLHHKAHENKATPIVLITKRRLFSTEIEKNRTKFKHNEHNFSFDFDALWYKSPELVVYRYMLEGHDMYWSAETKSRTVTYSNLPDGNYTFRVQAKNQNGRWTESKKSMFSFRIKPPFWKTLWFIIPFIIFVLLSIYLFIQLRTRKLQRDKDLLEMEVQKRTAEIQKQKEEIEAQRDEIESQRNYVTEQRDKIEEQNKDITASIQYASRIQKAVLPPLENFEQLLGDFFVFFKPRDIVSGDFYYLNSKNKQVIVAAADCTGHGVPGAFMSILSISLLNKIIGEFTDYFDAAIILSRLRAEIKKALRQTGENVETKDGLDISLCVIPEDKTKLQFSGAFNPLLVVRNNEAIIYKADKMPIGIHIKDNELFTNNYIELQANDMLYMYSDGFQDQFGGPQHRKYLAKRLRNYLVANSNKSTLKQSELLEEEFTQWKGLQAQIDDVLVIGIRV